MPTSNPSVTMWTVVSSESSMSLWAHNMEESAQSRKTIVSGKKRHLCYFQGMHRAYWDTEVAVSALLLRGNSHYSL